MDRRLLRHRCLRYLRSISMEYPERTEAHRRPAAVLRIAGLPITPANVAALACRRQAWFLLSSEPPCASAICPSTSPNPWSALLGREKRAHLVGGVSTSPASHPLPEPPTARSSYLDSSDNMQPKGRLNTPACLLLSSSCLGRGIPGLSVRAAIVLSVAMLLTGPPLLERRLM